MKGLEKIFIETTQEEYDKRFRPNQDKEVDDTSKDKSESKNKGENING